MTVLDSGARGINYILGLTGCLRCIRSTVYNLFPHTLWFHVRQTAPRDDPGRHPAHQIVCQGRSRKILLAALLLQSFFPEIRGLRLNIPIEVGN